MNIPQLPSDKRHVFNDEVWKIVRLIPAGKVSTYGQVASFVPPPAGVTPEDFKAFRARWAGQAMADCPPDVPWQRVINAEGKISPRPGAEMQRQLLEGEGVTFDAKGRVDLKKFGWAGPG